jgi:hypothetical protein
VAEAGLRNVNFTESDVNQLANDKTFDAAWVDSFSSFFRILLPRCGPCLGSFALAEFLRFMSRATPHCFCFPRTYRCGLRVFL